MQQRHPPAQGKRVGHGAQDVQHLSRHQQRLPRHSAAGTAAAAQQLLGRALLGPRRAPRRPHLPPLLQAALLSKGGECTKHLLGAALQCPEPTAES